MTTPRIGSFDNPLGYTPGELEDEKERYEQLNPSKLKCTPELAAVLQEAGEAAERIPPALRSIDNYAKMAHRKRA